MAKEINEETMENVCILAKLSLEGAEREKAREEMQKMLDYVEKLKELDTDGVEPLSHIFEEENVFREDVVVNGDEREAILYNAPKAKEGQFQVPRTIG
ncbi:MAG TPA: Asp-tRNA(Asn)/Glu-tRNA(Gln) amidotransferase subunit GatC [Candidatus Blautia faecigallinarum]|uniref:Aspartyl/glutamyl-tRNA(Asn/Gln) amidotransferase subunit C n=1 Tax=Candidatus Blautia faecigallinarum TaxID=2838488 RepID=A0A9D2DTD8_9FIRM|nr:Asp-tRNA(Asn)/Glu-tRNA(Gln) amidotransferase subunit GatC [Candidatus Blautia faecigallinarum]